ncbi:autotransporter beta-domain protein [Chlamydia ibidis]|uniref:Autotransporter beta-domain protein n=2 Tax=Chlamydia ibidis TaxID=1405396 RepID=S7J5L7_9CHLA|nr:Pmp family polymorphic membrane protein autotransporter adhesin [Chlamydia ibidis]EPP35347.1 autotransporter beta-domain protein [Chlamydia ibidis]EQM63008.1 autotransporter beta-domain protein [Chlamydia ibidis 10-1398/6]
MFPYFRSFTVCTIASILGYCSCSLSKESSRSSELLDFDNIPTISTWLYIDYLEKAYLQGRSYTDINGLLDQSNGNVDICGKKYFIAKNYYKYNNGGAILCDNVTIDKISGPIIFNSNSCRESGGAIHAYSNSGGRCTISNNDHLCCFFNNYINTPEWFSSFNGAKGGAICCRDLIISNNKGICAFLSNFGLRTGGAIFALRNVEITGNSGPIILQNNKLLTRISYATRSGFVKLDPESIDTRTSNGVLKTETVSNSLHVLENPKNLSSSPDDIGSLTPSPRVNNPGNSTPPDLAEINYGGAIAASSCTISNNKHLVKFAENDAGMGGAISCWTLNITSNTGLIVFENNSGFLYEYAQFANQKGDFGGGAILAATANITNNHAGIIFKNNNCKRNGGAICARDIVIKENGPMFFLNNGGLYGGALFARKLASPYTSSITLYADYGDIIFNNNYAYAGTSSYRNSIHSATNMYIKIGAREGRKIVFYDPIENGHQTQSGRQVELNPETFQTGTIVFSSYTVPEHAELANFFTEICNPAILSHGVLAVEDKAILGLYNFSQQANTCVRLGNSGVIRTTNKAIEVSENTPANINITNLGLHLPSLLKPDAKPAKIWVYPSVSDNTASEDTNPTITISGSLQFLNDENTDPYDSIDLSKPLKSIPLLYLCDNSTSKITTTNLDINTINNGNHYGYQGIWSPYWHEYMTSGGTTINTANKRHKFLYVDWMPKTYVVNPLYRGEFVANSLWQNSYTMLLGLKTLPYSETTGAIANITGGGATLLANQKNVNGRKGFRMHSAGYFAKAGSASTTGHGFALAFAQLSSRAKEKESNHRLHYSSYFCGTHIRMPWLHERLLTTMSLAYAYGNNLLKNSYSNDQKSSGNFHSSTLGSEIAFFLSPGIFKPNITLHPFIKLYAIGATQSKIEEIGDLTRKFSTLSPLIYMNLPIGLYGQVTRHTHLPSSWKCQLAYMPNVYLHKPKVEGIRNVSNGSWITNGTEINRHTISVELSNTTSLFSHMDMFINYHGNWSKTTLSQYLNVGSTIRF